MTSAGLHRVVPQDSLKKKENDVDIEMKNACGSKKNKKLRYMKEMIELEEVEDEEQ